VDGHDHDGSEEYDGGTHPPSHDDPSSHEGDIYDNPETLWDGDQPDHSTPADHDWLTEHSPEHETGAFPEEAPDLYSDTPYEFSLHSDHDEPYVDHPGEHIAEEPVFGADPDLPPHDLTHPADDWLDLPDLDHLTAPEPAGGPPWLDLSLLGDHPHQPVDVSEAPPQPASALHDLRTALGEPPAADAAYETLLTSDDPAVRTLAHLWAPP
jgi:hypothetical protein